MYKCLNCHYSKALADNTKTKSNVFCDYLCMEHKRRGCSADNCDKYKPREDRDSNFTRGDIAK